MDIIYDLNDIKAPLTHPVLTIGNFDGVHQGHVALFDKVKERARAVSGESVVMTFDPHPTKVMRPENGPSLITPTRQKLGLIQSAGIDRLICLPFTAEFAAISAQDFVEKLLVDKIGIKEIVVGYDYAFGYKREGDTALLRELGDRFGFRVHVLDPIRIQGHLVSSTSIRNLVREGRLQEAEVLLGRHYQICGMVVKGKDRGGKLLGFPTANLELMDELIPKEGIYAVTVTLEEKTYDGVANVGYNPTFGDVPLSVEVHLLDFQGDLLGRTIKVNFIQRLRDEKTFSSVEELSRAIAGDIEQARDLFQSYR